MISPLPLRALEHFEYCQRQAALIHVDKVWLDNAHVLRGVRGHERVDTGQSRAERGRRVLRGVALWSERYDLTGRADAVELLPDGSVEPVEYKHGVRHGRAAEIQLCGQALCLEEMLGVEIKVGSVWYARHRRRERVAIGPELREVTVASINRMRVAFSLARLPDAPNDERCTECQLRPHCMPDLVASPDVIERYVETEVLRCS